MVGDISQVFLQILGHLVLAEASRQSADDPPQRTHRLVEFHDLLAQFVDAPGDSRATGEDLVLDLFDVVGQTFENRRVTVHHGVQDRVDDALRTEGEHLRIRLHPPAHHPQIG